MPNFRQRKWLFVAIAIAVIILLTLIAAPNSSGRKNDSGSTYGRNPDGYGAWYEYMSQRHPIERWRKPFSKFAERDLKGVTYIQVHSKSDFLLNIDLTQAQENWVSRGNTLVIIGKYQPTSAAPFERSIRDRESAFDQRQIKIKTTRRSQKQLGSKSEIILSDRYGAVVWQEKIDRGKVIYCVTPYLAANAYQDSDNYQFLAELVSQNKKIWIDEYIHGYKDRETLAREQEDVLSYLIKTPWFLLFIQTVLIAVIAAVTALRRFGKPITPKSAIADNSTMYIDALAGVLELANSSDFVVDAIALDERRKLQLSLGLGNLVDDKTLIAAYQQKSESSSAKLTRLLQTDSKQKISNAKLISLIEDWQQINRD